MTTIASRKWAALAAFGLFAFPVFSAPATPDKLDPDWDFWETPATTGNSAADKRLSSLNTALPSDVPGKKPIRILIDPGHGGFDYGAKSDSGYLEKRVTLRLGQLVKARVKALTAAKKLNVEVRLTRENDTFISLRDRTRVANAWEADMFLSLHANSEPSARARGFEVYFASPEGTDRRANRLALLENGERAGIALPASPVLLMLADSQNSAVQNESSRFAEVMFNSLAAYLESSARAVRQAPFSVLSHSIMPSLLIEVGYLTHPADANRLKNPRYLKKVADAISQGILDYVTHQGKRP